MQKQGATNTAANSFMVPSGFEWPKAGKRHEYVRAKYENGVVSLFPNQSSGVLTSTSWGNGLAIIPADKTIKVSQLIEFIPFSELSVY